MLMLHNTGPLWRKLRRAGVEVMKPAAREHQRMIQMAEISQLLFDTREDPENLFYHLQVSWKYPESAPVYHTDVVKQRYSASIVFSTVCGKRIPRINTELSIKFFHSLDILSKVCEPGGAPPVDLLPILDYLPDRFANNWKAKCETIKTLIDEIVLDVVEGASRRLSQGQPNGSYIEVLMENSEEWELEKDDVSQVAGSLITAGTTTTASVLQFVALLITAFPEAQRKVQEELDRVIGSSRHPVIEDMPNLPYLNAFLKEINRFRPIAPTGVPHRAQEDIMYEGHIIPKDTTLFINVWGVYHSTDLYDHPEQFEPERFLRSPYGTKAGIEQTVSEEALMKLDSLHFGVGRRKCLGLPMAVDA
ncbi:hypothetical protein FRC03_008033, partial [Tulasnella sp. 419]